MQVNKQTHAPPILSAAVPPAPAARLTGRELSGTTPRDSAKEGLHRTSRSQRRPGQKEAPAIPAAATGVCRVQ